MFADDVVVVADPLAGWIPVTMAIAVTIGFIAQIVLQVMAKMEAAKVAAQLKADAALVAKTANLAALEAKAVKEALALATTGTDAKLINLTRVTEVVHDLVNSASIVQLKLYANATKRLAARSPSNPDDIKEAEMVEKELQERLAAQAAAKKQ